ncbi:Tc toxin subunit A [Yersinia pekkanenii]|uniref:Insecticidal toxin complex protein n=1 Tax=Yersinia pekkanenii TaxID=1288385 RepID=A0A0T9PL96_9GAMM|nr:Tc toxin subunit A [Yersinia pekkanenii]CNH70876.1 putative insecticidal toxin complex protein [Yersinia pekkanenii]CRY68194.1 putative insecticidal toxin complex protein [Yersinia pekkanenii]
MSDKINNTTSINVKKNHAEQRAQQLRNDPVVNRISKLGVNSIPERSSEYVNTTSIQSMFSPARYLCELYNVAKELHQESAPLHIDNRRPDLKDLLLNQTNMEQEVSTLDILLETLKKGVKLPEWSVPTATSVDDSFTLPYDDNLTIINAVLESKATSLRNIAAVLADSPDMQAVGLTPALVQEQLGLNPASYELVKTELAQEASRQRLAHATKLTVEQLNTLVSSIKGRGVNEEQILAVLSEYVRLNRQYGLSADKFTIMVGKQEATAGDQKEPRMETISSLFGLSTAQAEMLLTLCGKPGALQGIAQGNAPHVLTIISLFENILQWMSEQKLDLTTLQAMLTDKYSVTATPELFNFLSNIYHSMDKQAAPELLTQNLCRSLAAGFHLKTEVVAGLVSWLESNDSKFTAQKFNHAVIEVFSNNPTLEKLEHHPQLVSQCQKLSQYVLIVKWAKLTQQDIELLLQPKSIDGSDKLLYPSLSLLRLLTEFKAWQQQVTVPVSEALRYFSLFSSHTDVDKLEEEKKELQKQLAEENNKLKPIDDQRKEISNNIESSNKSLHDLNVEIKNIESSISEKKDLIKKINILTSDEVNDLFGTGAFGNNEVNKRKKEEHLKEYNILTSDLEVKNKKKQSETFRIQLLNDSLHLINSDKTLEDKKIESFREKINNNNKIINEILSSEDRMLVIIHGWDNNQMDEMIKTVLNDQYPVNFMAVNKLCKHINMANKLKVVTKDLVNLKSLVLEDSLKDSKTVIENIAKSLASGF